MGKPTYWILASISLIVGLVGFVLGQQAGTLPSRSAVYEIPMAKGQPWRVTSFRNRVYVLIEAPSMLENENVRRGGPLP